LAQGGDGAREPKFAASLILKPRFPLCNYYNEERERVMPEYTDNLFASLTDGVTSDGEGLQRKENIADAALNAFRSHYTDNVIEKADIFFYVYGLLNDPNEWSDDPRYILDLVKRVTRVAVETVRIVRTLPALE
jgi:predicted helicase